MRRRSAATALTILGIVTPSCREATGIRLVLRTNVPKDSQVSVALFAGSREDIESFAPVAEVNGSAWEAEQNIGSITLVPQGDAGGLTIRVTLSRGRQASECSLESADECVFARRRLAFIEHKTLLVPVVLYQQCEGRPCNARTTCNVSRECVASTVLPADCQRPQGCPLAGDPAIDEVIAPANASVAGRDASDGAVGGGGVYSADPIVPCFGTESCQGATPVCCHLAGSTPSCVARAAACPELQERFSCDNRMDCATGNVCCKLTASSDIVCRPAFECFSSHKVVCQPTTSAEDCSIAATSQCSPRDTWNECDP